MAENCPYCGGELDMELMVEHHKRLIEAQGRGAKGLREAHPGTAKCPINATIDLLEYVAENLAARDAESLSEQQPPE